MITIVIGSKILFVMMYSAEIAVLLSTCYNIASGFFLHSHKQGLEYLLKDVDQTVFQSDSSVIVTKWINQPLDHFDETETRTWEMRYFERLDFWEQDGPIYLFMYGESTAGSGYLQTGTTYELAKETKGALFLTEHRYYGESKPFNNYTTENYAFLSSRQALADNARFLNEIKSSPKFSKSKVVVVGGSYAGNLAAWMKLMYPDLVDAAIASSAPVLAKADFFEYLETVSDDFEQYGTTGCYDKIKQLFQRYDRLFKTDDGIKQLKEEEPICKDTDMNKLENQQLFFLDKASGFMGVAQYGNLNSIKETCQDIASSSRVISSMDDEITTWNEKNRCYDYDFDNMIESIKNDDWYKTWFYQTCTEFGYYQTSNSANHPFTDNIPVAFFFKMCTDIFGLEFDEKKVDEGVVKSNEMYGGVKPNVTHVVFVNGDLDPWHRLGVLEDLSYDAPAKRIPFSSHCRDLLPEKSSDPEELREARQYIKYLVKKWIGCAEYANLH